MLRMLRTRETLAISTMVLLAAGTTAAQEPRRAAVDANVVSLSRLSADAFVPTQTPARTAGDERARQRGAHGDEEEPHRWDAIKTGFYTGLVLGGLVGVVLVSECGHPECGPLLSVAAGIGASIGMGIDALVDRRPAIEGVSAHNNRPGRGRRLSIAIRKSW
jgi:hypothetical protein